MQFVCPCLNVEISVSKSLPSSNGTGGIRKLCEINGDNLGLNSNNFGAVQKLSCDPETLGLTAAAMCHPFFSTCGPWLWKLRADDCVINLKLPVLVRSQLLGHLSVHECLLCGTKAYASGGSADRLVLVRNSLINDESVIAELRQSPDLSPVFGVVLPKVDRQQISPMINANGSSATATTTATAVPVDGVCSRQCLNHVQIRVDSYLKAEQEAMEERIRVYVEQQSAAFETLKSQVKAQKNILLSVLSQKVLETTGAKEDEGDSAVPLSPLSLNSGDISPGPNANMSALPSGNKFVTGQFHRASNHVEVASDIGDSQEPIERPKAYSNPGNMLAWKRKRHSGGPGRVRGLSHYREEEPEVFSLDEHGDQLPAGDDYSTDGEDSGTGDDIGKYLPEAKLAANDFDGDFDEDDHFPADAKMLAQMTNGGGPKIIRSNRGSECDELGKSLPVRIPQRWTLAMKSDDEEDIHVGRGSERKPLGLLSGHNNVIQLSQVENVEPQQRAYNNWEEKLNDHQPDSIDMGMEGEMFGQMEGIPQDITAESFQVLARSLHPADDPERLFGDRPNRRRYRTGEVMRAQPLRDF